MPTRLFSATASLSGCGSRHYQLPVVLTDEECAALDAYLTEHPGAALSRMPDHRLYHKIEAPFRRRAELDASRQSFHRSVQHGAYGDSDGIIRYDPCVVSLLLIRPV